MKHLVESAMRPIVSLLIVINIFMAGCIGLGDFEEWEENIYPMYGMTGWEMVHHFEKDENNQTTETLTELEIEYNPESAVDAEFVEFWLIPGDNSERLSIDPKQGNTIPYMYSGYGAFMAEFGVVDSLGNEDTIPYTKYDWPAVIRSAQFYLNQTQASEPADLFVDAPNPNSVGSPERIIVESTIGNSFALPFTSEPTDITWSLIDPEGNVIETHTETIDVGDEYTWEFYLEFPMRGDWQLTIGSSADVNINQTTKIRMGYSGFMYDYQG